MTVTDTQPGIEPAVTEVEEPTTDQAGSAEPAVTDTGTDTSTDTSADTKDPDTVATVQVLPELVHVDPATLIVAANIRADVQLDKPFLASIRDHGVLVPIVARRRGEQLIVEMGQRRTVGAVEVGRSLVPVYIVDAPTDAKAAEVLRIIRQLIENDHRTAISDTDRVQAHQQLSLLGLSAGQIARRTGTGVKAVKAGLEVAGSELAAAAMARYDLTLDQAGVLAEFEDDTEAVKTLTVTAKKDPGQFAHLAQRLRDKRTEDAARAALLDQLATAQVPVIEIPAYSERRIRKLRDLKAPGPIAPTGAAADEPDGDQAASSADPSAEAIEAIEAIEATEIGTVTDQMTPEAHVSCPGHAAYLEDRGRWSTSDPVVAVYVCTDWQRYGHESRYAETLPAGFATGGKMTEEQKAERRVVVANNKAWDSAQVVRREWLTAFLARKTAPKDAPQWIAATLASCSHEVRRAMEDGHKLALQLLGLSDEQAWSPYGGRPNPVAVATQTATPGRATMLSLGLLLGGLEASTSRASWRAPISSAHSAYFAALQRWGYVLSDVEQLVIAPEKPRRAKRTRAAGEGPGEGTGTPAEGGAPVEPVSSTDADLSADTAELTDPEDPIDQPVEKGEQAA